MSIQLEAVENTYDLETQNDLLVLAKRNNAKGTGYFDGRSLLKQVVRYPAPVGPLLDSGVNDDG